MPSFKPKEVVKILRKLGYIEKRQRGSHLIMWGQKSGISISVPIHTKDLKRGLLKGIIKDAKSSEKEFLKLKK